MKLPDDFKFTAEGDCGITYKAQTEENCTYNITWVEEGKAKNILYNARDVGRYIRTGEWKILPESFLELVKLTQTLGVLISEREDASDLAYEEFRALRLTRELINRLLDDGC